jgi:hypothetical protein
MSESGFADRTGVHVGGTWQKTLVATGSGVASEVTDSNALLSPPTWAVWLSTCLQSLRSLR